MRILVTGGAGFIGSNLVKSLLGHPLVSHVRVLDNLSNGKMENLNPFLRDSKFSFINGDITHLDDCLEACKGMDAISHQAALGSVPRSISNPQATHHANMDGFVNMIEAARVCGIQRFVYASSSSVYGDLSDSPKVETKLGKVLSPYAAGKLANEIYAEAWSKLYDMQFIGFRYFNVFGPNQDPNGPYAAVIPLFIKAALLKKAPKINGDGTITRDFTPVANVVQINISALTLKFENAMHEVFNVACGKTTSLNELWSIIRNITHSDQVPEYGPIRKGDILQSLADIKKAMKVLNYQPVIDLTEPMEETIAWYSKYYA